MYNPRFFTVALSFPCPDCLCHVWGLCDAWWEERAGCPEGLCVHGSDQHPQDAPEPAAVRHEHHDAGDALLRLNEPDFPSNDLHSQTSTFMN